MRRDTMHRLRNFFVGEFSGTTTARRRWNLENLKRVILVGRRESEAMVAE